MFFPLFFYFAFEFVLRALVSPSPFFFLPFDGQGFCAFVCRLIAFVCAVPAYVETLTLSDVDSAQKGGSNDVKRGLHDDGPGWAKQQQQHHPQPQQQQQEINVIPMRCNKTKVEQQPHWGGRGSLGEMQ